jgi:hypothetical protein
MLEEVPGQRRIARLQLTFHLLVHAVIYDVTRHHAVFNTLSREAEDPGIRERRPVRQWRYSRTGGFPEAPQIPGLDMSLLQAALNNSMYQAGDLEYMAWAAVL